MNDQLLRAEELYAQGALQEAEKLLLDFLRTEPLNLDATNDLGVIACAKGDSQAAEYWFLETLKKAPMHKDALINYSDVLRSQGRIGELLEFVKKAQPFLKDDLDYLTLANEVHNFRPLHSRKIAFLCLNGLQNFLSCIVAAFDNRHEVRTVYSGKADEMVPVIQWADTIWIEWANELAVWLTNQPSLLTGKRVLLRLHSYEAFAGYATNIRWENIDDLIFVAAHIRRLVEKQVPDISSRIRKDISIVPNGIDLQKFRFIDRSRGKNIAFLGSINFKKGPMMLFHAFLELVRKDPEFHLFIGGDVQDQRYSLYFEQLGKELHIEDHIHWSGPILDVPHWLEDKQHIVCSSVLEGHPVGLMEGMATGLKPLIHNFVGARDIYPAKYLWTTTSDFANMATDSEYSPLEYREFVANRYSLQQQLNHLGIILDGQPFTTSLAGAEQAAPPRTKEEPAVSIKGLHPAKFRPYKRHSFETPIPLPSELLNTSPLIRARKNYELALTFYQGGNPEKARVFINRAILQSDFSGDEIFQLYCDIHIRLNNYEAIKEGCKRRAVVLMRQGSYDQALLWFEKAINSTYYLTGIYETAVDQDISEYIRLMARDFRKDHQPWSLVGRSKPAKLHLGYLMEGFDYLQAPTKNFINYARRHDKDLFDISFYSRWRPDDKIARHYNATMNILEAEGCRVNLAPPFPTLLERVLGLFEKIKQDHIDVFITSTLYTVPHNHFLCALSPAPLIIKDVFQQPEMSSIPDLTVHHSRDTFMEDTGRCVWLGSRYLLPDLPNTAPSLNLSLPPGSIVFFSSGRAQKFNTVHYWRCINQILTQCPQAFLLVAGLGTNEFKFQVEITASNQSRIILAGFREDIYVLLKQADVYLDTFPQGGGYGMAEAMSFGLPCLTFGPDFEEHFRVSHATYSEILDIPELIIKRWDYEDFVTRAVRLAHDSSWRHKVSERVKTKFETVVSQFDDYIIQKEQAICETLWAKVKRVPDLREHYEPFFGRLGWK